jgi:glyoxylase-like metal-dependent hydrolase (beta-lactamase superfamily II)
MKIIVSLFYFFSISVYAWDLGPVGQFQFDNINNNVYVMHGPLDEPNKKNIGFMNNPGIVVAKNGIILIDPGGTYQVGKQVLKEIEKISKKPIIAVLNTHIHGDHWLANQAVKEKYPDIKMYAHPKMIKQANGEEAIIWLASMKRMTEGLSSDTKIVPPFIALNNQDKISIDGEHFIIHSVTKSHTNTDIMIEHKNSKTLFLGDNGFSHRMGRFDDSSDISGNINALQLAQSLKMTFYVPGHGKTGSFNSAVKPFLTYLEQLKKSVLQGYEEGLEDFEIKEKIAVNFTAYKKWHGFDTNFGKHINKLYLEAEAAEF